MKSIHIGKVQVPIVDYAVGASAVLGIRDSGKTVTSKGVAEQLIDNGVPIIVFDAVGKWRWMKVAGQRAGGKAYKVVVAGGNAPDLPLTPHSVPEIVRAALKERIPLIIDLFSKTMSKADWRLIVQKAIHIIHYENEGGAVHVFLEEAAEFVPQKIYDGETYAEVEKLVRMGGNASVGITLINQRSQEVNKAVLDNCSTALVLGCQVGKNAIEAVEKWIERLDPDTAKEVTESLPRLQAGEAWVWTRKSLDKPSREKMPMCRSFHPDRRTPEIVLKSAKPTDTAEFVARMSSSIPKVIEEARANDPTELKRTIASLKKELEKSKTFCPKEVKIETKEVAVLKDSQISRLIKHYERMLAEAEKHGQAMSLLWKSQAEEAEALLGAIRAVGKSLSAPPIPARTALRPHAFNAVGYGAAIIPPRKSAPVQSRPVPTNNGELTGTQQKILDTIKMLGVRGLTPNRDMVARWMDIHPNGGRYGTDLALLKEIGLLDRYELTESGVSAARDISTGLSSLKSVLAGTQQSIIEQLESGQQFSRETLAEQLGIHPNGGRYGTDLARLRTMGVIPDRGTIKLMEAANL